MKQGLLLIFCLLLFISAIIEGCVGPDDGGTHTPVPTQVSTSGSEDEWETVSPQALLAMGESREVLIGGANDVREGNTGWLFDALPPEVQEQVEEPLEISSEDAEEIASALLNAREVEIHENLIIYETTYQGRTHSFYTIREWEKWKIVGF
jgi:hypothetical protein